MVRTGERPAGGRRNNYKAASSSSAEDEIDLATRRVTEAQQQRLHQENHGIKTRASPNSPWKPWHLLSFLWKPVYWGFRFVVALLKWLGIPYMIGFCLVIYAFWDYLPLSRLVGVVVWVLGFLSGTSSPGAAVPHQCQPRPRPSPTNHSLRVAKYNNDCRHAS